MLVLLSILVTRLYYLTGRQRRAVCGAGGEPAHQVAAHPRAARRHLRPQPETARRFARQLQRHHVARGDEGARLQLADSRRSPKDSRLDPDLLRERFDDIKSQPAFETIVIKEGATSADIAWVEAHMLEQPELSIREQPQRRYPENGVLAHVLGYVGEISPAQLKQAKYKEKGYRPGDIIGQEGLESFYDDYLRGRDGYRKVEVDSRGRIQRELEVVAPQPGQDLITTIDLDLQIVAEEQSAQLAVEARRDRRDEPEQRRDRRAGFALRPSTRISSRNAPARPKAAPKPALLLRDTRNSRSTIARFAGATRPARRGRFRWPMPDSNRARLRSSTRISCAAAASPSATSSRAAWDSHGSPDVRYAIRVSCDGYFYRLGLKMELEGIRRWLTSSRLNKRDGR